MTHQTYLSRTHIRIEERQALDAISSAIQDIIPDEGAPTRERVLAFVQSGGIVDDAVAETVFDAMRKDELIVPDGAGFDLSDKGRTYPWQRIATSIDIGSNPNGRHPTTAAYDAHGKAVIEQADRSYEQWMREGCPDHPIFERPPGVNDADFTIDAEDGKVAALRHKGAKVARVEWDAMTSMWAVEPTFIVAEARRKTMAEVVAFVREQLAGLPGWNDAKGADSSAPKTLAFDWHDGENSTEVALDGSLVCKISRATVKHPTLSISSGRSNGPARSRARPRCFSRAMPLAGAPPGASRSGPPKCARAPTSRA